jgi:hypothetical protein
MKVGQATFLSDSTIHQGRVDLVARSSDLDQELLASLAEWTPGYWEVSQQRRECINFFRPCAKRLAISRSVFSRSDFGRTQAVRVTTSAVVFEPEHLAGFHNNVVLFANAIRTRGALFVQQAPVNSELPILNLPDRSIFKPEDYAGTIVAVEPEKIVRAIEIHRQVAIIGVTDPMRFLCALLAQLPVEQRFETSFSTGLDISDRRPFNLQFFSVASADLKKELVQAQVRMISLESLFATGSYR